MPKIILILSIVFLLNPQFLKSQGNYDFEISKNLDIYYSVWKQLNLNYVDPLEPGKMSKIAIEEMLKSLDPFTNYYAEADIEDVRFLQTGKYGGVGSLILSINDTIVISLPYIGFPIHKSGMRAGDKILAVDGQSVIGKTTNQLTDILRGVQGTKIKINYLSVQGKITEVEVERAEVLIKNVPYFGLLNNETAYVKLIGFSEKASEEVSLAIDSLKKCGPIKNVIIDLRDNGGGLLQQAVEIMNLFIPAGETIVSTKGKVAEQNFVYRTTKAAKFPELNLIVMVNNHSASASEIIAGATQDLDRGIVVGQKSYGKGLVQKVFPLSYMAQIKITVAKYYTPSGRCIQAIDYDHKDELGKAHKIADSLINTFKTKNGRIVKDAGGIEPDTILNPINYSNIEEQLMRNNLIFNFVTQYLLQNNIKPDLDDFELSDAAYTDFLNFLRINKFEYLSDEEKTIAKLIENQKLKPTNSELLVDLNKTQSEYKKQSDAEFLLLKDEIKRLIRIEIMARFYFERGMAKAMLYKDPEIETCLKLFMDKETMKQLLNPKN